MKSDTEKEGAPENRIQELKKISEKFPEFFDDFKRNHPNWEAATAISFLSRSLGKLKELLDDSHSQDITWENPYAEFRFEVEFAGTLDTGMTPILGKLNPADLEQDNSKSSAISSMLVNCLEVSFLSNLFGEVAMIESEDGYFPLLGEEIFQALSRLDDNGRESAIRRLMRPISFGAGTVEYDHDANGAPLIDSVVEEQLGEIREPLLSVPLSVNGYSMRLIAILEIRPPVINPDSKIGYFPILTGIALQMCDENTPEGWYEKEWAQLRKWTDQDREAVWAHLKSGWESIFSELGFKNKKEFKEVMVTLQATIRVPVNSNNENVGKAIERAQSSFRKIGEVTSIAATITAGVPELGIDRTKGWQKLLKEVNNATESMEKGRSLERLLAALFNSVPGFEIKGNIRTSTEEIDLWIVNSAKELPFSKEQMIILVECKHWSKKVGKNEFVLFHQKMVNRGCRCSLGFLVSWNGFSSTVSKEMLRMSHGSHLVVLLERNSIEEAVEGGDFVSILENAMCKALEM